MLVFQNKFRSVLDAAVVDRCVFFEICCSDAPCLTEAMQQRGISWSSIVALRAASETTTHSDVRSSLAGFLRNDLGRHGSHHRKLRIRTIRHVAVFEPDRFSKFFEYAAAVFSFWWTHLLGMACKVCQLVFCRDACFLELSRKVVVENN